MTEYVHPETLVDADWVADHIDDPRVRLIDVDEDTTAYDKGHIRNAVGWNWFSDLHDPLRRDYVDQEGLSRLLQRAGVGPDTTVVLYGGNNNWFAAYAYWLCRYLGFDAVKLLDGGRKKWELEGRELTQVVPSFAPTDTRVDGLVRGELRALREEVLAKLGQEPRSTGVSASHRSTYRRNKRRSPATSRARSTSPGARPPTTTAPSGRPTSSRPSTRAQASAVTAA
jgi:thiosulfate/3-mercaptopyruvate sulfurtransferase